MTSFFREIKFGEHQLNVGGIFLQANRDALDSGLLTRIGDVVGSPIEMVTAWITESARINTASAINCPLSVLRVLFQVVLRNCRTGRDPDATDGAATGALDDPVLEACGACIMATIFSVFSSIWMYD